MERIYTSLLCPLQIHFGQTFCLYMGIFAMNKYSVLLRGENFELKGRDGNIENLGFYTTKIVKASSHDEAESKAIELIKQDKRFISSISSSKKEPTIHLELISRASFWEKTGGSGYTFWPMNSVDDE